MFGGWFKGKKKEQISKETQEDVPDDETLQKQGYDPEKDDQVQENIDEAVTDFSVDYPGYQQLTKEEIFQQAEKYTPGPGGQDLRHEEGHKKGGRICADDVVVKKLRGVGKYMLKQVGKKLITGNLNLTKISFPIAAMIPKTALETSVHYTCLFPVFLNKAASINDPLERLKIVATSCLASFFYTNTFLKPLNPILGETLHGTFPDGTDVYCEQISHHPPVSYIYCVGPNGSYKYHGYYDYDAGAGMNSVSIYNKGKRVIEFKDGQKIKFDFPNETYSGTFMGTLKQESYGKMTFTDEENQLVLQVELGKVKKRPSDYFAGKILKAGEQICTIEGTYLGYIDIDGKRYWDINSMTPHILQFQDDGLESDHKKRSDLNTLKAGQMKVAQQEKERMENEQRADRKLREAFEKQQAKDQKQAEKDQKKADKAAEKEAKKNKQ